MSKDGQAGLSGRMRHAASIALLGAGAGALVGLTEGSIIRIRQALGTVTFASHHVVWMTAIPYALVFLTVGIVIACAALVTPKYVDRRTAVSIYVAGAVLCLLLPFGWLSRYAIILLAAGVASRVWLTWNRHAKAYGRFTVRYAAVAGLAAVIAGAAPPIAGLFRSGTAEPPEGALNVVLLIWDTARAQSLGLYGYERPTTPELERIARTGVVFENAISTSPWTLPSHSTMFTGQPPHEMSADWFEALDGRHITLADWFRGNGWRTGGFVANHHYTSEDSGLSRGFEHYEDYRLSLEQTLLTSYFTQTPTGAGILDGIRDLSLSRIIRSILALELYPVEKRNSDRKHADEVNDEFLEWIDGLDGEPFFAFLNYFDAHLAYWAPPEYRERFTGGYPPTDAYDAALAWLDFQTGRLFDALEERGILDRTLIIVTSDHGELFREHDLNGHASNLYRNVLRVPLLVHLPGPVPAGLRVEPAVSLADIAATVAALTGVPDPPFPGSSLERYFGATGAGAAEWALAEVRPGRSHPDDVPLSRGPMTAIVGGGYHYILNGDGREELFEWSDTEEANDLALRTDPATLDLLAMLRDRMRDAVGEPSTFQGWARRDSLLVGR